MSQYSFLPVAYHQGQFKAFEEANISIATHALHYGTAAFGGLRGIINSNNQNEVVLFRLDNHAKRLSRSAKYIDYQISEELIRDKIIEFVRLTRSKTDFYIRPLVYISDLGISPHVDNMEKDLLIYGLELGEYLSSDGVTCCFSSWIRQEDASLPLRGKITGAYITSSLAKSEATNRGFGEAILLNSRKKVCEGSGMNLFMVRDGKLITPDVTQDILEGITRDSVIQVARDNGIEVVEREIDKTELLIADEVFLTGTAAKVSPVKKIEMYDLPDQNPITQLLLREMGAIYKGQNPRYEHWITRVNFE